VLAHEPLGDVGPRPPADDAKRRSGQALGDGRPGPRQPVDVLVCLEDADEERDGLRGQRCRLAQELVEVHVRRKGGGRLDPELADEPAGERRDGADGVGSAQRRRCDRVSEAGEHPPRGRAVEAGGGAPVAVHLDDDARLDTRDPSRQQSGRGVVGRLADDDVGAELP
jgi:hypothetical protein